MRAEMPRSLEEARIGAKAAREINWMKETLCVRLTTLSSLALKCA